MEEKTQNSKSQNHGQENLGKDRPHDAAGMANGVIDVQEKGSMHPPIDPKADIVAQLEYAAERLKEYATERGSRFTKKMNNLWQFEDSVTPSKGLYHNRLTDFISEELICLDKFREILQISQLGRKLLEECEARNVTIQFDNQTLSTQLCGKEILIHPSITLVQGTFEILCLLRRQWLSTEGDILYPLAYEPDDAVLLHRILEADSRTFGVWVAWELKLAGFEDLWQFLKFSNQREMVLAFEKTAKADFRSVMNGKAARAAFDAFFGSGLMNALDQIIIQEMLIDHKGLIFGREEPAIIITPTLIDFIGELPTAVNYLVGTGEKPLSNSDYAAVRNRSNANFLWFIKFERSFQETERRHKETQEEANNRTNDTTESLDQNKVVCLEMSAAQKNNTADEPNAVSNKRQGVASQGLGAETQSGAEGGATKGDNVVYLFGAPSFASPSLNNLSKELPQNEVNMGGMETKPSQDEKEQDHEDD